MKKVFPILLTGCLATPVAAQPFSESMAECAALHQNAAQWVRSDEAVEKLMFATYRWAEAAITQAELEGTADAATAMWAMINRKTVEWEVRGAAVFATDDFRDWTDYCRAFAKDRGIETGL